MVNYRYRKSRRGYKRSAAMGFRPRRRSYVRRPLSTGAVRRTIDAELKFSDNDVDVPIPRTTGAITHITDMVQGDGASQRTGNWIKPVTWYATMIVIADAANAVETNLVRLMAVLWKENDDANPITLAQIVQNVVEPHQGFNIQNKGQFQILWSRAFIISTNPANSQFQKMYKFYLKPKLKVLYSDAVFKNNHLFLIAFSDVDTLSNPPVLQFSTRLRYTDS